MRDIELMVETVETMVECRLQELANLAESQGPAFAASVMLSVCAELVGASLAMTKDTDLQRTGGTMFIMAMHKAMAKHNAGIETQATIEKAKA